MSTKEQREAEKQILENLKTKPTPGQRARLYGHNPTAGKYLAQDVYEARIKQLAMACEKGKCSLCGLESNALLRSDAMPSQAICFVCLRAAGEVKAAEQEIGKCSLCGADVQSRIRSLI